MSETQSPPPDRDQDKSDDDKRFNQLKREYLPAADTGGREVASAGLELGLIFIVLALAGWWADRKFDTSPALLLIGCLVGIVGGLYRLIRHASRKK